jgi:putative ATP-dependent endonuclease of OLD family
MALYFDDGKRGLNEASLGSANVALLALKLAEFAWRRAKNERNYTLLIVEELEAHLHPHLQRNIFQKLLAVPPDEPRALFVTTHSPNIASVAKLKSIVLLRSTEHGTQGFSLAQLNLSPTDLEDLQRYIDATRAELLFASGVIFVEGDAEVALLPVFARSAGYDLDELGITLCSVGGMNFSPYVKLAKAFGLPFAVVTDWDPMPAPDPPRGRNRDILLVRGKPPLEPHRRKALAADDAILRDKVTKAGLFVNESTLEAAIGQTPELSSVLLAILEAEKFGPTRRARLDQWKADPSTLDPEQLLAMVDALLPRPLACLPQHISPPQSHTLLSMSDKQSLAAALSELAKNREQYDAVHEIKHCVVRAGPGSGKTKALTGAMARALQAAR